MRGGPQHIPRPADATTGGPPPWADLDEAARTVTADGVRRAFAGRIGAASFIEEDTSVNASAVLAPFYERDGELYVVLTRRSWDMRSHTGEVSFPGGRADDGETPLEAALREAYEEIGLDPSTVEVLGELDHLMTVSSRSFIVPYVGLLSRVPELSPNPDEVDAVLHVPVHELLRDDVYREEHWIFVTRPPWLPEDTEITAPIERSIFFFELIGDTVWGATAAMLRHLLGQALGLDTAIDHA